MAVGHEKLDVYRAPIESVGWASRYCKTLTVHRNAKGQRLRAAQAIALSMLTKLGQRGYAVREGLGEYRGSQFDTDTDTDTDTDSVANDTEADKLFTLFLHRY